MAACAPVYGSGRRVFGLGGWTALGQEIVGMTPHMNQTRENTHLPEYCTGCLDSRAAELRQESGYYHINTHYSRRPRQTFNHVDKSPPFSCVRARILSWNLGMTLIIQGGTSNQSSISHSNTRSTESYAFARSMKQIFSEVFLIRRRSCSLCTTNNILVVER